MAKSDWPNLYSLLDTLVALRIEFEGHGEDREVMEVLAPAKVRELCSLLDAAIGSTKLFIGEKYRREPFYSQNQEGPGRP
jgi:hypothetical protein